MKGARSGNRPEWTIWRQGCYLEAALKVKGLAETSATEELLEPARDPLKRLIDRFWS